MSENKIKICGFSQLHDELEKGNLENWFKCMSICDYIYIYDQNSSQANKDYYKKFPNAVVIESPINDFENELICKNTLLKKIQTDHPDCDWIMWLDGDTMIDGRLIDYDKIRKMLNEVPQENDSVRMGHVNLWRSDLHVRLDNLYMYFDNVGRLPLWRSNKLLSFPEVKGLHNQNNEHPIEITNAIWWKDYKLIHRGFATDKQIIDRFHMYKSHGQEGYNLTRLVDESTLEVMALNKKYFPSWYKIVDKEHPSDKPKLVDIIRDQEIQKELKTF